MLEGLQAIPVAGSCTEPQISPSQYSQWRDQLLVHAFEVHQHNRTAARLAHKNARLKPRVGELTCERNTSDVRCG